MGHTMFLDIETTGFSREWCSVLEIAAEIVDDSGKVVDQFHRYVKPYGGVPAKITQLTGITNAMVAAEANEISVLTDFLDFVYGNGVDRIIGHNCKAFDLPFIAARLARCNKTWDYSNIEIVDTLVLARQLVKQGKISVANCQQVTLAEHFGIEYDAHSAIEDIHALEKVYLRLNKINNPEKLTRAKLGF